MQTLGPVFIVYHLVHNVLLYFLTDVALVYGYLSDSFGWDWELWSAWIFCIAIVTNVTAIMSGPAE